MYFLDLSDFILFLDRIDKILVYNRNKASGAYIGFSMDYGVKDDEPSKDNTLPQFSFGPKFRVGQISIDEDSIRTGCPKLYDHNRS